MMSQTEYRKTAAASWVVYCMVKCPHCEAYFDIEGMPEMAEIGTAETVHDAGIEIDCPDCGEKFTVNEIEY